MRPLSALLPDVEGARVVRGDADTPISGVSNDTRRLQPGEAFVAIPGQKLNGLDLVPQALAQGAAAIVAEAEPADPPRGSEDSVPLVLVPSARTALADLAAAFHGHPSTRLPVVGITGTDGKTTTTHLLSAILEARGLRTGWLTTVSTKVGPQVRHNAAQHTTPEAPLVQATLAEMLEAGVEVAILETSSHALALDRVRAVRYRVGVFTNLTPEHLNFHGTFEAYRASKSELFRRLPPDGLAVLNADDPSAGAMRTATAARVVTYALDAPADLTAGDISLSADGTDFTVRAGGEERRLRTCLVGRFNVANWLAAFGAATSFGATLDHLAAAAQRQEPVPGRMSLVRAGQPFPVVVDFAHTPGALESVLDTVRSLVQGRVLLVFGMAGGGRDTANRPVMGALAARKADFFVLTTDDPYEEDPADIARQIAAGATGAGAVQGERFVFELDRRRAIGLALARAAAGDAVLLTGIGHESHRALKDGPVPWNEAEVAREELRRLGFPPPPAPRP